MRTMLVGAAMMILCAGAAQGRQNASSGTAASPSGASASTTSKPMSTATSKAPVVHSALSIDCSKQADAKGLHGKARKSFRSQCKQAGSKP